MQQEGKQQLFVGAAAGGVSDGHVVENTKVVGVAVVV